MPNVVGIGCPCERERQGATQSSLKACKKPAMAKHIVSGKTETPCRMANRASLSHMPKPNPHLSFHPDPNQMAVFPEIGVNAVNGLGEPDPRRPRIVYWPPIQTSSSMALYSFTSTGVLARFRSSASNERPAKRSSPKSPQSRSRARPRLRQRRWIHSSPKASAR